MNFALPALAWIVLSWQGGLHPWQPALAALILAVLVWRERSRVPAWSSLGSTERVLALLLLAAGCGAAASLRPQDSLNAVAGLGLGLTAATLIRRQSGPLAARVAALLMLGGAVFATAFVLGGLRAWFTGTADPVSEARWYFPNQNLLAAGLALPALLLGLARMDDARWKYAARLCVLPGALALVYAGSRGAYFALAVGALWLLLRRRDDRMRFAVWTGLLLASIAVLAMWAPFSRLAERMQMQATPGLQDVNYYRRADFWEGSAKLSLRSPVLGQGLGSFAAAAYGLDLPTALTPADPIARYRLSLDHAHNEWLELAVETGWPITLALLLCAAAWKFRRLFSARPDPDILGLETVLLAAGALSLVDMNLRTPGLAWGLMLCFCAVEAKPPAGTPAGAEASGSGKLALAVSALAVYCLLGAALGNRFKTDHASGRAGVGEAMAALCLQPLDAEVAEAAREQGLQAWPWSAWAGRQDPAWWWREALHAGDGASQEADARRAVALRPYYAPGWYWLGLKLEQNGEAAEATQDMDQALSLEPNFCRVLAWQADQARDHGDRALERSWVQRVFQVRALKADSPDAYTAYLQSADPAWLKSHAKTVL